jgi:plastocyanin
MQHLPRAVLLPALLALVGLGCGRPADAPAPAAGSAAPAERKAARVVIDHFSYAPRTLTVAPGTRVVWVNRDDVPHTVTSSAMPRLLNSGALDTDDQFSHVFTDPGTYDYFCAVHPKMTARVVVK